MTAATYVLVPGAGGSAWYWHRVAAELRRRGHDVVAPDLPADDDAAGLDDYADTVLAAVGERQGFVLVGQSMGSYTALLVCRRVPVALLVLVNAMIPAPGETPGEWWGNTGQAAAKRELAVRQGRPADAEFDPFTDFLHDVPPDVAAEGEAHQRDQSGTPFGRPWSFQSWPNVPTRVLIGRDDRFFPAEFQRRVTRERLGVTPDEMPGGHLVALSRPEELTDRLEAYRTNLAPVGE